MQISKVDAAIDHAVNEIAKTDAMIAQVRDEYLQITVASPQDKDGYKSAEVALKKVVRMRTSVEKTRKDLKADSVRYGKAVDAEARRIREQIEPIEEHLKTQCDVVRLEEARQAVAAENARRDEVNGWVAELSQLGWPVDLPALQRMTAEEFGFLRLSAKKRFDEQAAERLELEELRKLRQTLQAEKANLEAVVEPDPFVTTTADHRAATRSDLVIVADSVRLVSIPKTLEHVRADVQRILEAAAAEIEGLV